MSYTIRRKAELTAANAARVVAANTEAPFDVPRVEVSLDNVTITPRIAAFLLANHNAHNRPVKETRIDQYATSMKLGKFRNVGERILFDVNGQLVSGQHRLLACVKSGVSFVVDLKFGLPEDARLVEGGGCPRTAADQLRLVTGDGDAAFKIKGLNGLKKILNRRRTGTDGALAIEMLEDFRRGMNVVNSMVKGKSLLGRGPAAGALILAAEAYPVKVRAFIEDIQQGTCSTDAGKALSSYLISSFNGNGEDDIASKVLFAVYAHLTGKEVTRLLTTKHDEAVDYFLDVIQRDHALKTLAAIAPARMGEATL